MAEKTKGGVDRCPRSAPQSKIEPQKLTTLRNNSDQLKAQGKSGEEYNACLRQLQMLAALENQQHEKVDMTSWVVPIGEFLAGRVELHLPNDLAE